MNMFGVQSIYSTVSPIIRKKILEEDSDLLNGMKLNFQEFKQEFKGEEIYMFLKYLSQDEFLEWS